MCFTKFIHNLYKSGLKNIIFYKPRQYQFGLFCLKILCLIKFTYKKLLIFLCNFIFRNFI